jgi:hypothetical protein
MPDGIKKDEGKRDKSGDFFMMVPLPTAAAQS